MEFSSVSTTDLYQFTTGTPSERFPFILKVTAHGIYPEYTWHSPNIHGILVEYIWHSSCALYGKIRCTHMPWHTFMRHSSRRLSLAQWLGMACSAPLASPCCHEHSHQILAWMHLQNRPLNVVGDFGKHHKICCTFKDGIFLTCQGSVRDVWGTCLGDISLTCLDACLHGQRQSLESRCIIPAKGTAPCVHFE